MTSTPHNPDYKLIEVTINGNDLVYGETNDGDNKGLEVYYYKSAYHCDCHYSRRFKDGNIPMIYHELYINLSLFLHHCQPGHKLVIDTSEYRQIAYRKRLSA